MKNHYVYRITNLKENKHYYGVRSCDCEPKDDIGIKYFSSSLDKKFIKEQQENIWQFKYKVVRIFETRTEATNLEIKLHNKFDVGINEIFYNRAKQTSTGWDTTGTNYTSGDKNGMYGKTPHNKGIPWSDNQKLKISGKNHYMYGKKHSEEFKQNMSKSTSGIKNGMYGKAHSEESIQKMSESAKNRPERSELSKNKQSSAIKGRNWYVNKCNENIFCFSDDKKLLTCNWKRGRKWNHIN